MSEAPTETTRPEPDEYGRYRVINGVGHEFSTRRFVPDAHTIADGPASDVSGNPIPPKHREIVPADAEPVQDQPAPPPADPPVPTPGRRRTPQQNPADPATTNEGR